MALLDQLARALGRPAGRSIGRYRIVRRLAEGGMGEIFLALAQGRAGFQKVVVVKRILQQSATNQDVVRMFLDEARLMAALNHPNIVQVYDFGSVGGAHFFVMEYVHGQDLGHIMKEATLQGRPLPLEVSIGIIAEAAAGLHHAHEMRGRDGAPLQIVHRDISPSNLLVSYEGAVKLTDFGIAKWTKREAETRHGAIKGKIAYMSPEQCRAGTLDRRSDVFGLGILLFELTTGTRLFQGASDFAVLEQIVNEDAPRPSSRCASYPLALEAIVMRALERDPEQRYQTARDMQLDLEALAIEERMQISAMARADEMATLFAAKIAAWHEAERAGHSLSEHLADEHPSPAGSGPAPRTRTRPEGDGSRSAVEELTFVPWTSSRRRRGLARGAVVGGLIAALAMLPLLWPRRAVREARLPVQRSPAASTSARPEPPARVEPRRELPTKVEAKRPAAPSARMRHPTRTKPESPNVPPPKIAPAPQGDGTRKIWDPDSIYLP